MLRRKLKKATDVRVTPEEIVGAIRRILNEVALGEMENIKISLPERKQRSRKSSADTEECCLLRKFGIITDRCKTMGGDLIYVHSSAREEDHDSAWRYVGMLQSITSLTNGHRDYI